MKPIYLDSSIPEKEAKNRFHFPENIMMENAASSLESLVLSLNQNPSDKVLIFCGNGNNGGDGLVLSRKIYGKIPVTAVLLAEPKTNEAQFQFKMASAVGVPFAKLDQIKWDSYSKHDIIVDCVYGTGFHGEFTPEISDLFEKINKLKSIKIACDIPSGISKQGICCKNTFTADFTVTMGALKNSLFSDEAKNQCGKILISNLGISESTFASCSTPDAFLIENSDVALPLRNKKSSHKGTYGHTVVFSGNKAGAAILSASAALHFGSGLTSLYETEKSNLSQFKISPSLMIAASIPAKTSCVVIGNGLGINENSPAENQKIISDFTQWFNSTKKPNCVIDADLFSYDKLPDLLKSLSDKENSQIILTPHPKEFQQLVNLLKIADRQDYSINEVLTNRIDLGKEICSRFPNITLIVKSANTYIFSNNQVFVCNEGTQALSKGGSGDVLAGMAGALLAQGYDGKTAAITACYYHGAASKITGAENYALAPENLIDNLEKLF